MSEHYKFFQNRECEYFPCHKTNDPEHFNCLFCFCPLYALGERCGGGLQYTESGIKDCSACRTSDPYRLSLKWHAPIASVAAVTAQPLAALLPYGCGVPFTGVDRHAGWQSLQH